jgi:hypothetical protein
MRTPKGFSITLSPYRGPTLETMPVDAKAGCLYPNNSRSLFETQSRGFDNAIGCDMLGNVAERATANVFMAKDGVVFTPLPNGTFLAGITRRRVIGLLLDRGVTVVEKTLTTGNSRRQMRSSLPETIPRSFRSLESATDPCPLALCTPMPEGSVLGVCAFMIGESLRQGRSANPTRFPRWSRCSRPFGSGYYSAVLSMSKIGPGKLLAWHMSVFPWE